mmetsp:Transcript_103263/g.296417  ORF Transcript_103263/g.296417 Transcript_103263/m.296417 type:complete len:226 (-) Transcript_103263:341-1018(-)
MVIIDHLLIHRHKIKATGIACFPAALEVGQSGGVLLGHDEMSADALPAELYHERARLRLVDRARGEAPAARRRVLHADECYGRRPCAVLPRPNKILDGPVVVFAVVLSNHPANLVDEGHSSLNLHHGIGVLVSGHKLLPALGRGDGRALTAVFQELVPQREGRRAAHLLSGQNPLAGAVDEQRHLLGGQLRDVLHGDVGVVSAHDEFRAARFLSVYARSGFTHPF